MERARARLVLWMDANPKITQTDVGRAAGHNQGWVSKFKLGQQDADVDELDAMARVFGHSLMELLDLRPDPKERELIEGYRALTPPNRVLALQMLQAMIPERVHKRERNGGK